MSDSRPVLRERVITPHGGMDAFTDAIRAMVRDVPQSRALGWRMFLRDTRAMYRQSLLGYFWILLPPIATAAIWIFLNNEQLVSIDTGDAPVPIFIMTGTVLWTAFNMSVVGMQAIMAEARSILSKVNFPHEALVVSGIGKALLNSMIPALVLIPALPAFGISWSLSMLLFPLGFMTLIVFGCAVGLILVPLSALYMDIGRAVQLGLRFGFFATPVIYALPATGSTRTLLLCNPVTSPLVSSRYWLIGSESPQWFLTLFLLMFSVVTLAVATVVFKVTMPHIIERTNA